MIRDVNVSHVVSTIALSAGRLEPSGRMLDHMAGGSVRWPRGAASWAGCPGLLDLAADNGWSVRPPRPQEYWQLSGDLHWFSRPAFIGEGAKAFVVLGAGPGYGFVYELTRTAEGWVADNPDQEGWVVT